MVLLLSLAATLGAQEGGDLQAQILYAYQTEDLGELGNLTQRLGNQVKAGGADAALRYHLAHAEYRFGLLASRQRRKAAAPAFSDCVDQLKSVLDQDAKSVEALALQSACYRELAKERHLEAVLLRSRADERLKSAVELAPRNPRVLYLVAMEELAAIEAQLGGELSGRSRLCLRPPSCSSNPPPRARTCRVGATPRRISRSACSWRRAATCSVRATGSRSP